jgi:hypothetical protein
VFRDAVYAGGQGGAGGSGNYGVGLVLQTAGLSVRAVDLDHGDAFGVQVAGQASATGAVPSTPISCSGPKPRSQLNSCR